MSADEKDCSQSSSELAKRGKQLPAEQVGQQQEVGPQEAAIQQQAAGPQEAAIQQLAAGSQAGQKAAGQQEIQKQKNQELKKLLDELGPDALRNYYKEQYKQSPGPDVVLPRLETSRDRKRKEHKNKRLYLIGFILMSLLIVALLLLVRFHLTKRDAPLMKAYITQDLQSFDDSLKRSQVKEEPFVSQKGLEIKIYAHKKPDNTPALQELKDEFSGLGNLLSSSLGTAQAPRFFAQLLPWQGELSTSFTASFEPHKLQELQVRVPLNKADQGQTKSLAAWTISIKRAHKSLSLEHKILKEQDVLQGDKPEEYVQNTTELSESSSLYKGAHEEGYYWALVSRELKGKAYYVFLCSDNVELLNYLIDQLNEELKG